MYVKKIKIITLRFLLAWSNSTKYWFSSTVSFAVGKVIDQKEIKYKFLGRQNIAFRGHRDQGNLTDKHNLNEMKLSSSVLNEGNFRRQTLLMAVTCCDFIITLFALTDVLSVTLPASILLQSYDRDIAEASDIINGIILTLSGKRSNCESDFSQLFEQSKNVMNTLDIDLKLPRIAKRQTQRSNTPAQSPEKYYRRVLYIPLLENISEDFQSRFLNTKTNMTFILMLLIPSNVLNISNDKKHELLEAVTYHYAYLDINILQFQGEIELWKTKWIESKNECKYLIYICLYVGINIYTNSNL